MVDYFLQMTARQLVGFWSLEESTGKITNVFVDYADVGSVFSAWQPKYCPIGLTYGSTANIVFGEKPFSICSLTTLPVFDYKFNFQALSFYILY